jgi:hypothetical protein
VVLFTVAPAALVAMAAGTAREAEATFPGTIARIVFDSTRTTGKGVYNPTEDNEIFTIRPDGTGLKQITHNRTAGQEDRAAGPRGRNARGVGGRAGARNAR